jgi:hypothetical protein
MQFVLDVPYFGKKLLVIADDKWKSKIQKYGEWGELDDWYGGFFHTKDKEYIIAFDKHPTLNTVTHEVNHFVNQLFIDIGHIPYPDNDEIETYVLSHFVEEVYKKVYNIRKIK